LRVKSDFCTSDKNFIATEVFQELEGQNISIILPTGIPHPMILSRLGSPELIRSTSMLSMLPKKSTVPAPWSLAILASVFLSSDIFICIISKELTTYYNYFDSKNQEQFTDFLMLIYRAYIRLIYRAIIYALYDAIYTAYI
jgi:hypothetical protein